MQIGSLVLRGIISPASLVDGTMTLLDLNYIENMVRYKDEVTKCYNSLINRENNLRKNNGRR